MNIEYSREAVKHIETLDKSTKQRIKQAIEKLPGGDVRKLTGFRREYRLRVGNYRILFSNESGTIVIKDVLPRQAAYKKL